MPVLNYGKCLVIRSTVGSALQTSSSSLGYHEAGSDTNALLHVYTVHQKHCEATTVQVNEHEHGKKFPLITTLRHKVDLIQYKTQEER